jgi:N-acetylglucosamine-6-phosphate deacetylase
MGGLSHISGKIVLGDTVLEKGVVSFMDGVITSVRAGGPPDSAESLDCGGSYILPGFIDVHLHGSGECDASSIEGIAEMAAFGPRFGLTAFCPAIPLMSFDRILDTLRSLNEWRKNWTPARGARVPGAHLEGPYINPLRKGGMPAEFLRAPSAAEAARVLDAARGALRLLTISPELPGAEEMTRALAKAGITVAAGHTVCPPELLKEKIEWGITHVCHLFDTFDGREVRGGVTQASLADEIMLDDRLTVEIIPDAVHVPETLVRLTARCVGEERFVGITDSMRGAGLPDGEYKMADGRPYIIKKGDASRLADGGALVGSALTMDTAFANLVTRFGFSVTAASKALSANPAGAAGAAGSLGSLEPGKRADIVVMSPEFEVQRCLVDGRTVWKKS